MSTDEEHLRDQLHRTDTSARPDVDVDALVRRGVRSAHLRRRALIATGAAAVVAVAVGGVAFANSSSHPQQAAATPTTHAAPTGATSTPDLSLVPPMGGCKDTLIQAIVNGTDITNTDTAVALKAGSTVTITLSSSPTGVPITSGVVNIYLDKPAPSLTPEEKANAGPQVTGITNADGQITYQLPLLATATNTPLPAGAYNISAGFVESCPGVDRPLAGSFDFGVAVQ